MKIWTKRILLFLICMGVAGCLAVVWLSAYVKSETAARILSAEEAAKQDADCILVLGCGVRTGNGHCALSGKRGGKASDER